MKKAELEQKELEMLYTLLRLYAEGQLTAEGYHGEDVYEDESYDYELISRKDAKALLKRLKPLLNKRSVKKSEKSFLFAKYGDWNRSPDEDVIGKIEAAITNKKALYMEYFSPDSGRLSKRNLNPYAQNYRYVVGYCHLRKEIRKFSLSRIVNAKLLKETFTIPKNFDKKQFL